MQYLSLFAHAGGGTCRISSHLACQTFRIWLCDRDQQASSRASRGLISPPSSLLSARKKQGKSGKDALATGHWPQARRDPRGQFFDQTSWWFGDDSLLFLAQLQSTEVPTVSCLSRRFQRAVTRRCWTRIGLVQRVAVPQYFKILSSIFKILSSILKY